MKNKIFLILIIFVAIFALNFIWEATHSFLYTPHYSGFSNFIFVHIKASLGDVLLIAIMYLSGFFVFKNNRWFLLKRKYPYMFLVSLGFCLAVIVENFALKSGRWVYNDWMPIIPLFNIGLTPVLQLTILPPVIMWITLKYYEKYFGDR
ncbi:MAG: hypothetical protein UR66_C0006G0025 [Candidatus Moranbacteria bacterium GW2011_GWE1_35_17]|nr:MAG: hypothetical protein UR66_C0006G0025 [Candidatus Moranbacteria bacterium GW2011_GWE1_35_17]KKP71629.1 MAG: hypothetical protein UR65_C0029G0005 [Candidatus Moranbacteria bacterium GW2011_GWE2_35_164]KKP82911.1 MAG: hypothetical protein UR82_C0028G0006 [Candidatus Moranbacteria bacterium GW2011_GWF1_35_5]KKP84895.1 MAG: hypothetical protein UR83_C0008G0009 [Candidatus Moranbacteria bacterium GW2011_GWF2_35_54]